MQKTIILSVLLITFLASAHAQIPNGSFENWTTVGGYSNPDGWDNFNSLTAANSVYTCEKGTAGAPHGASYIMLTTRVAGTSTVPGLAVSGKYDLATKKPKSGFAYTGRPARLTGKWQYMAIGTDTGRIAVYLTKWNGVTGQRDLIGSVEYDLPGMVMSWTSFSIPLSYHSAATPDKEASVLHRQDGDGCDWKKPRTTRSLVLKRWLPMISKPAFLWKLTARSLPIQVNSSMAACCSHSAGSIIISARKFVFVLRPAQI